MNIAEKPHAHSESVGTVPDHIWGYFTDLRREVESYVPGIDRFLDGLPEGSPERQVISKDFEWASRMKREIKLKDEDVEIGSLAEAILFGLPGQYSWYGDGKDRVRVTTVKTTEYDDYYNGADLVREVVLPDGTVMRWIEDITLAHPAASSERAHDVLREKMREPLRRAAVGQDSGMVKYFESVEDPRLLTRELFYMPRIIISLPRSIIIELAELDQRVRGGDRNAVEKLRQHPARQEYLSQLRTALETYKALALAFIEQMDGPGGRLIGQKRLNLARRIAADIDRLIEELPGLREGNIDAMENRWLGEFYGGAVGQGTE
jgi:hypothetical protein